MTSTTTREGKTKAGSLADVSLETLYEDDIAVRIATVRRGVSVEFVKDASLRLGLPRERVYTLLGTNRSTVGKRYKSKSARLNAAASERAMFLAEMARIVEEMIPAESADTFDSARWLAQWLEHPQAALGGQTPGSLMDTGDGRDLVRSMLRRMGTGAYS